jgi:very-short-patch-repair endonuclease
MSVSPPKDVLIAFIPNRKDLGIAQSSHWYRIPYDAKNVPVIVKDGTIKIIAFYQPKIFMDDAFSVRYYGIVQSVGVIKRKYLFKEEPVNDKSENQYYKIQFEKLIRLPVPIVSHRKRRILFITTNLDRFQNANEINDLFFESSLEEKVWAEFKRSGIRAERQYFETAGNKKFVLDFALFCKNCKLDVECDGDNYHTGKSLVQNDKRRSNLLESKGWNVMRYTTEDIETRLDESITQVKDAINFYGGLIDEYYPAKTRYFPKESSKPTLFDGMEY